MSKPSVMYETTIESDRTISLWLTDTLVARIAEQKRRRKLPVYVAEGVAFTGTSPAQDNATDAVLWAMERHRTGDQP